MIPVRDGSNIRSSTFGGDLYAHSDYGTMSHTRDCKPFTVVVL